MFQSERLGVRKSNPLRLLSSMGRSSIFGSHAEHGNKEDSDAHAASCLRVSRAHSPRCSRTHAPAWVRRDKHH
jgi:hypothetical protein